MALVALFVKTVVKPVVCVTIATAFTPAIVHAAEWPLIIAGLGDIVASLWARANAQAPCRKIATRIHNTKLLLAFLAKAILETHALKASAADLTSPALAKTVCF